jgi:hypothetical protein
MFKKFAIAILAAASLAACASSGEYSGSTGKTLLVSKEVWDGYKDYATKISGVNKGILVVGVIDGVAVTYSGWYCPGSSCFAENYGKKAFDHCRSISPELECIRFANSADIVVNYKVEGE